VNQVRDVRSDRPDELAVADEIGAAVRSDRTPTRPSEKGGTATMKLTTVTNVSVDGVMQGLGGPDEDRRGGFERGGWALPLFENDNEAATFLNEVYQRADAFLFGRQTYEIFAGSWGSWAGSGGQPHLDGIEYHAQVRRIEHAHRTAVDEHDRPLR
jgi:hypothetical protein